MTTTRRLRPGPPRGRATIVAALALASAVGLAGCGGGVVSACPAVGYTHALIVTLDGDRAGSVADVQLCTDEGCEPNDDADPAHPGRLVVISSQHDDSWTFTLASRPQQLTVRTLGADGTVLADTDVTPRWVRVGGSAECGGPNRATVTVPT